MLADQLLNARTYPFRCGGSSSWMGSNYAPATFSSVTCYQEEDFSISTFGKRLCGGHAVPFHILSNAAAQEIKHFNQVRSVTSRMIVNDQYDFFRKHNQVLSEHDYDSAIPMSVQKDRAVLLGYIPCATEEKRAITTSRTSIYFPRFGNELSEVVLGDTNYGTASFGSMASDWVFVRDHGVYFAFFPMIPVCDDRVVAAINMRYLDEYAVLSFYGRCAFESKEFDLWAQRELGGGFVCETGSVRTDGNFEAFRAKFKAAKVEDHLFNGRRRMFYERGDTKLELDYDWRFVHLTAARIDGKIRHETDNLYTSQNIELL